MAVTLTRTGANPITLETQTGADGSYAFAGLPSGVYTITEKSVTSSTKSDTVDIARRPKVRDTSGLKIPELLPTISTLFSIVRKRSNQLTCRFEL